MDGSVELGLGESSTDFSGVFLVPFVFLVSILEGFVEFLVCELGEVYDCFAAMGAVASGGSWGEGLEVLVAGGWDMEGEVGHGFLGWRDGD